MTDLEKLRQWLPTFPQWEEGGLLYIDYTDGVPGCAGLYPVGVEELSRREDILGRKWVRNRCRFALYRVANHPEDSEKNARWLLDFQGWVQAQSEAGLAPTFGDEPGTEVLRAEGGKLHKASQPGTGVYLVTLTGEFTKHY